MNNFEKTIIGVAKTDQALNKISMIVGAVTFLGVALVIGVIAYNINKKVKQQKSADGEDVIPNIKEVTSGITDGTRSGNDCWSARRNLWIPCGKK